MRSTIYLTAMLFVIGVTNTQANTNELEQGNSINTRHHIEKNPCTLRPNPTMNICYLHFAKMNESDYIFELFDSKGALVQSSTITHNDFKIDTHNLPTGIYMYKVSSGDMDIDTGRLMVD